LAALEPQLFPHKASFGHHQIQSLTADATCHFEVILEVVGVEVLGGPLAVGLEVVEVYALVATCRSAVKITECTRFSWWLSTVLWTPGLSIR